MKEGSFFKNQSIINAKTKNKLAIKTTQTSLIAIALSAFTACLSAQSIDINQNFSSVAEIFSSALSDCDSAYNTTYVTRDIIWNNNNVFIGDVTVNSDVNLTIKSTIGFGENASLNILPGARVVIDSGKLTKACSGLWQGIDVYGYPFTSQSYEDYHGIIRIINNGKVEYAHTGIETREVDPESTGYAGGIIKIDSGTIRNNITGIKFNPFQNTKPGTGEPWPNVSYIKNCTFLTDTGLVKLQATPEQHISFLGVSGIPVTACNFYNTTEPQQDPAELGKGILSVDADFFMNGKCVEHDPQTFECTKWQQSRFANLDYGVYALNTHSNRAPTIKRTLLEKNKTGIYLSMTPQASVTLCDFDISKLDFFPSNEHFAGLYLNVGCDGFQVEENYFYNSDSDPFSGSDSTIGIVVNNSGAVSNEVYNNYFEDLDFGVSAQGANKGDSVGLLIRCNDFDSCQFDIVVVPEDAIGIAQNQGNGSNSDPENMAGNLFYIPDDSPDWDYDDIDNEGELFNYYYSNNAYGYGASRIKPEDFDTLKVNDVSIGFDPDWTFNDGCPSYLEQSDSLDELRSEIMMTEHQIDSTKIILKSLIDGGETAELQEDVEYSAPPESMEIYNELMSESPYLSDTVISTAIEKEDVLPNAMMRDVMIANPNTAKSNKLMTKLDDRFDPMPEYMKSQILQGKSILSIREETEADLAMLQSKKSKFLNAVIRYYRYDTINSSASSDSLLNLYKKQNQLWSDYNLALEYLSKNDSTNAVSVLDSIPDKFNLTTSQSTNHQVYEDYFDFCISLTSEGKTIYQADSVRIAQLYSFLDESTAKINSLIRNLLIAVDSLTYEKPYYFPDIYKSTQTYEDHSRSLKNNEIKYLKVFPNPANSYIIINYLNSIEKPAHIYITDLSGKLIESFYFSHGPNQKIFDIRSMKSGIYIATLILNKTYVESIKFTIIK